MPSFKLSRIGPILLATLLPLCLCQAGLAEKPVSESEAPSETAPAKTKAEELKAEVSATPAADPKEKKAAKAAAEPVENFIVQASSMDVALKSVEGVGGKITHRLGIIDAVAADLTKKQIKQLTEIGGVKLHANRRVQVEN